MVPQRNPKSRFEDIDEDLLLQEPDVIFVQELQYSNGAVYHGQMKTLPERVRMAISMSQRKSLRIDENLTF